MWKYLIYYLGISSFPIGEKFIHLVSLTVQLMKPHRVFHIPEPVFPEELHRVFQIPEQENWFLRYNPIWIFEFPN